MLNLFCEFGHTRIINWRKKIPIFQLFLNRNVAFRYEIALRQIDPSLALPYWDSTLDGNLPNPRDSSIWTDEFMGNTDAQGNLVTGDFAGFRTLSVRLGHESHQIFLYQKFKIKLYENQIYFINYKNHFLCLKIITN